MCGGVVGICLRETLFVCKYVMCVTAGNCFALLCFAVGGKRSRYHATQHNGCVKETERCLCARDEHLTAVHSCQISQPSSMIINPELARKIQVWGGARASRDGTSSTVECDTAAVVGLSAQNTLCLCIICV